jgi:D-alanyl-D-alanine carboxypeptidase (penicillin-binding protein 5/6)
MKAREDASAALLNYGYTFYESLHLRKAGEIVLKPRVYKGSSEFIGVAPHQDVNITVGRGAGAAIRSAASVKEPLIAPLSANTAVGELSISDGAEVIARIALYPQQAVAEGGWWTRVSDTVRLWFN